MANGKTEAGGARTPAPHTNEAKGGLPAAPPTIVAVVLPVMTALQTVVISGVLTLEITMQPAVVSPGHVVVVVRIGVLMLQLVVHPVVLLFQPVVLAIMTMGIARVVGRSRRSQRSGHDRQCRREKEPTHLTLLYLLDLGRLTQVR